MGYFISFIFFLSGATALVYEILWARQLGLLFGTSVYATTTVLAVFFSGLATGSFIFGKLVDRTDKPLRLYGIIELLIGIFALTAPALFKLVENFQGSMGFDLNFQAMSLIRFMFSFLILIIPTTLIGGTLPVIIKYFSKAKSFGKETSRLYGLNTLGAVMGTTLAGFFLMPQFGIKQTNTITAFTNITIGILVIFFVGGIKVKIKEKTQELKQKNRLNGQIRRVYWALFFSGLSAIALEVLWTRMLILIIGVSTYAFSIVLITFLLGISLGSFLIKKVIDKINPLKTFIKLELLRGVSVILIIPIIGRLPFWYLSLIDNLGLSFNVGLIVSFAITILVLLVPTVLMGMTFPVAVKAIGKKYGGMGETVGSAYFTNTLGGVVGSLLAGFVLTPLIGVQKSMLVIAGIYFGVSFILSKFDGNVGTISMAILFIGFLLPNWNEKILSSGLYDNVEFFVDLPTSDFEEYFEQRELIFYKEGVMSLVGVGKEPNQLTLLVNGKSQSSSNYDTETQLMLGHLPMLSHENPKKALVIGLGTGMTLGAVEQYDGLREVVVVEIEPEVVEAAGYFKAVNNNSLEDKRLKVVTDDGRNYLLTTDNKFDVISSQPSNLWIKGMGNLYTLEFFELAKKHLTENGVMVQWIQLNTLDSKDLKSLVASFHEVFGEISVWETDGSLYLIGGNNDVQKIVEERFDLASKEIKVKQSLLRMNINSKEKFMKHFVASGEKISLWVEGAMLHTDDRPFLEFNTPRSYYDHEKNIEENTRIIDALKEK